MNNVNKAIIGLKELKAYLNDTLIGCQESDKLDKLVMDEIAGVKDIIDTIRKDIDSDQGEFVW